MKRASTRATKAKGKAAPIVEEDDSGEEAPLALEQVEEEEQESEDEGSPASGDEDEDEEGSDGELDRAMLTYMAAARRGAAAGGSGSEDDDDADEEGSDGSEDEEGSDDEDEEEEGGEEAGAKNGGAAPAGRMPRPSSGGGGAGGADPDRVASGGQASTRRAPRRPNLDEGSDSSDDDNRNTIGNVPLEWYKHEDHIGYDRRGVKLAKKGRRDALDNLLDRNDGGKAMRTIYDEYNDEEITLTKDELKMIMRIREGKFPHVEVNPFEEYNDWYTRDVETMPLNAAPEPKRRFIPSKWEEKKIVRLVRALRNGWIKRDKAPEEEPEAYLLWADDGSAADKTGAGLTYIAPPKAKVPGHEESYNPSKEYIPTEEEVAGYDLLSPEDRPAFIPKAYPSLRLVPAYDSFIKERFERCLDLYLCPRTRRRRLDINPEDLVPKLPKPRELEPFPKTMCIKFLGHRGRVNSVAPDTTGQWLASSSDDGTVKLWDVLTGRCMRTWDFAHPVKRVAWCPSSTHRLLSCSVGKDLHIWSSGVGTEEAEAAAAEALRVADGDGAGPAALETASVLAAWGPSDKVDGGMMLSHRFAIRYVTWHARGDYVATVCPDGNTQSVLVHQLSKRATQNPFRKNKGRVVRALFHPVKPFFFLATQNHVRIYNLAKQELAKKLQAGGGSITSMAVHPSGDHIIVGAEDKRVCWFDLDLSTKPYKTLRYHTTAVQAVAFHKSYPLFASAADDGTCQVFHGTVYQDLMSNPLLVPVKVLRGHDIVGHLGVTDCAFHPGQPWVFTGGADGNVHLYCN